MHCDNQDPADPENNCSCFCSLLRSLHTHLSNFLRSSRSSLRMLNFVQMDTPWQDPGMRLSLAFQNVSSHGSKYVGSPYGIFSAEVARIIGKFGSFNLLDYILNQGQPQGLVPKRSINSDFYFDSAFTASGKANKEVPHFIAAAGRGGVKNNNRLSCPVYWHPAGSKRNSFFNSTLS